MANRFLPVAKIGLREQRAHMQGAWPEFKCTINNGLLVCRGHVQPLPICSRYKVRIEYSMGRKPRAFVEAPPLRQRQTEETIPHTYAHDRPCLFYPDTDWRSDKLIGMTIIPWLMEWLVYYEAWLVTGEWQGGGIHPLTNHKARDANA